VVIIVAYVELDLDEAAFHRPVVVLVDEHNRVREQRPA
jgi:aspartate 1-decarboxylase